MMVFFNRKTGVIVHAVISRQTDERGLNAHETFAQRHLTDAYGRPIFIPVGAPIEQKDFRDDAKSRQYFMHLFSTAGKPQFKIQRRGRTSRIVPIDGVYPEGWNQYA